MNIGPLLRSMMGDVRTGEPKSLELRTGQVVRGTILSVSEDGQDAVIQVQGVKLHAALETPLRQGETTLLQVQPEAQGGLPVLKPMEMAANTMLSAASLAKTLESLGLENTPANRELLQLMQKSGLPLTKENVLLLQQVSGQRPAGLPLSEWVQAAGIAFSRGLPITGESVAGLHQAIFGPPLHVLLSSLEEQLGAFLRQLESGSSGAAAGKASPPEGGASTQVPQPGVGTGTGTSMGAATSPGTGSALSSGGAQPNQAAGLVQLAQQGGLPVGGAGGQAVGAGASAGNAGAPIELAARLQTLLLALGSAMTEESMAGGAAGRGASDPLPSGAPGTAMPGGNGLAAGSPASPATAQLPGGGSIAGAAPASTHPAPAAEPWVGRVLKLLGAEHEQQVLRAAGPGGGTPAPAAAPEAPPQASGAAGAPAGGAQAPGGPGAGSVPAAAPGEAPLLRQEAAAVQAGGANTSPPKDAAPEARAASAPAQPAAGEAAAGAARSSGVPTTGTAGTAAQESLKGLLLQAMASSELPAPLQEAARQLVMQLTGQQLLLNTDRTAPFAQVTMFLPFIGPDGQQTAAVHIESRRGRKGELDPANCRLWFDLQMQALGQIMVDVQVADKKVLLKLYSEKEATGVFLESRHDEIEMALAGAGYKLLSLKAEPLISPETEDGETTDFSLSLSYAPSPYKGVDYRV
ncbi:flagellar hook-length control protein FliK [Paenibacillus sanguinis]|uniref:flagellar hook-length control protein FliK n=1 Tax=Paenibacillus sanguinis TaxID=225906 RepID=UPI000366EAF5|nr:flagellar hook-length control protein FliK [Paenibacillus sanguinis]